MTTKPARSQSRSIGLVGTVNLAITVIGIAQALIIGRMFGITSGVEIYFAALAIYQSMFQLMQSGQIVEIFTPMYHELKYTKGQQIAFDLFSVLLSWMVVFALFFSAIMYLAAGFVIPLAVPGFESHRVETCVEMFRWLIPVLVLQITYSLLSNLLAGEKQFVGQEVGRLISSVLGLAILISFAGLLDAWVMVLVLWVSGIVNMVFFAYLLHKLGYRYHFRFTHTAFSVWSIFRKLPSVFGYVFATQIYTIAITAGLSMLPPGSLAIFTYARRIGTKLNGLLMRPISFVFFNHFSSALAQGDKAIADLTIRALRISLIFATFGCVITLAAGFPGLKALWLSEKFSESSVFQTYVVLCVLTVLPFITGVGSIFRKINISHQLIIPQYILMMISQLVSAVLAYFLVPIFGMTAVVGVVIFSTALMAIASGCLLIRKAPGAFAIYLFSDIAKCAILLTASVVPIIFIQHGFDPFSHFLDGRWSDLLASGIYLVASLSIASALAFILKIEEFLKLKNMAILFFRARRKGISRSSF